ncbi:hypothetical protein AMECASPLE_015966 [Ameca splendens]|uniref:AIG1-type G domain-containing protein n=1 Tax=Ameca splendens TaxID=208324 RepID=A0ABV0ZAW1_9TELE
MGSCESISESSSQFLSDEFTRRIVVLGKTGAGKSTLANTLFGQKMCETNNSPTSGTSQCQAKSGTVNGKSIIFVDTPGFFDTGRDEQEMRAEIVRCINECPPGPHVFLIVLKVEKYTEQEEEIIKKITEYFTERALKFATVLFTRGDQLHERSTINDFVSENKDLSVLVKKCGNHCNVIDNKYWKNDLDIYRSNKYQVKKLLTTIDKIIEVNNGGYYTQEMLPNVNRQTELNREKLINEVSGVSTRALFRTLLFEEPMLVLIIELTRALAALAAGTAGSHGI